MESKKTHLGVILGRSRSSVLQISCVARAKSWVASTVKEHLKKADLGTVSAGDLGGLQIAKEDAMEAEGILEIWKWTLHGQYFIGGAGPSGKDKRPLMR